MENFSKQSHHQTINTHALVFWAFIENSRLLPAPPGIIKMVSGKTRKPKSWTILQSNGMWLPIIHSVSVTGNNLKYFCIGFILFLRISYYATTSTEESVYIIGGWLGGNQVPTENRIPVIAKYNSDKWYNTGNIYQSRHNHGVITSGSLTMIIGGQSNDNQP